MRPKTKRVFSLLFALLCLPAVLALVSLLSPPGPANGSYTNGTNTTVQFAFNQTGSIGAVNCTLVLDSVASGAIMVAPANTTLVIFANHSLTEAAHTWNISCVNATAGIDTSATSTFTVDRTNPAVFAPLPINMSVFNTSNVVTIGANVTDTNINTSVYANITLPNASITLLTLTNVSSQVLWNTTFAVPNLTGLYSITFTAVDKAGNQNSTTKTNFTVSDVTAPAVFAVIPTAQSVFNTTNTITIGANVTDNVGVSTVTANITLPNASITQITLTNISSTVKWNTTYTIPNLVGAYNVTFIASDAAGNINRTTKTNFSVNDILAPVISSVSASTDSSSATITWTTDEAANSTINYGATTALGTLITNASFVTSHSILISGLSASAAYYYNITSCDAYANCNISGDNTFSTTAAQTGNDGGGGSLARYSSGSSGSSQDVVPFVAPPSESAAPAQGGFHGTPSAKEVQPAQQPAPQETQPAAPENKPVQQTSFLGSIWQAIVNFFKSIFK